MYDVNHKSIFLLNCKFAADKFGEIDAEFELRFRTAAKWPEKRAHPKPALDLKVGLGYNLLRMEMYRSGRNEADSKSVGG